jgi:hypothetical protein
MSKRIIIIASILLLIILIIGIGISIAGNKKPAIAELNLNATDLRPTSESRGLAVRGGDALLHKHVKELATGRHQVLQLDVLNLS